MKLCMMRHMTHFAFCMYGDQPAPVGGDTKSWFYFYKVGADETWVGIPDQIDGFPLTPEPKAGDRLWFFMDDVVLFTAPVISATHEELHVRWELHYDSNALQPINRRGQSPNGSMSWKTGPVMDQRTIWLEAILGAPPGPDLRQAPVVRDAYAEELLTLGIVQRNQGEFILVPVRYNGQERYALAAKRDVSGEEKVQVLALCFNLEQDGDVVASLDGTIAQPLRLARL